MIGFQNTRFMKHTFPFLFSMLIFCFLPGSMLSMQLPALTKTGPGDTAMTQTRDTAHTQTWDTAHTQTRDTAKAKVRPAKKKISMKDTLDHQLDMSDYLINMHGFVPWPVIISEPSLGSFGLALAIVFISPKKSAKKEEQRPFITLRPDYYE